jgi:hypothetical protein
MAVFEKGAEMICNRLLRSKIQREAAGRADLRVWSLGLLLLVFLPGSVLADDRFTPLIENAGEPVVNSNGFVVNQARVAVQKELSQRPPTAEELGVKLPSKAKLSLETTARQIAQYDPTWRVYEFKIQMPRDDFKRFFLAQGLRFDQSSNVLRLPDRPGHQGEFIDGLSDDPLENFRIWRRP